MTSNIMAGACALPTDPLEIKLLDLRNKAYIPETLPNDFLKISLTDKQKIENRDTLLAQRLQYGAHHHPVSRVQIRGKLQLTILEARLAKNYGFTKMDPYIKLNINGKIVETPTDYGGGKNPLFNKTIICHLPKNVDSFGLEIYDEKQFTSDEQIAVLHYIFPDELFEGVPIDEWFPLSGKLGEQKEGHIHIKMLFVPVERLQRQYEQQQQQEQLLQQQRLMSQRNQNVDQQHVPNPLAQTQPVQPQEPEFTDEDVKALKEMFPSIDDEVIRSLLETNNGNKDATINQLLQLAS